MDIVDVTIDGRGLAKHEERVIFVEDGVPGDQAEVHVFRKEKKAGVGRITQLETPSPLRKEADCVHFAHCGGCKWQHMTYEGQLQYKEKQVRDSLDRIAKVPYAEFSPIMGAPEPLFYRNKLEYTFSNERWRVDADEPDDKIHDNVLGFHVSRNFWKILSIEQCLLMPDLVNKVRNHVRDYARKAGLSFYDHRENTGFLRNLVFRASISTGEWMVMLIVGEDRPAQLEALMQDLSEAFPEIPHLLWIHNPKKNSSYTDLDFQVFKGLPYITESLGPYQFRIRATSFFQTNPAQAAHLYGVVKDFVKEALPEGKTRFSHMYDLYSGTGSIGIFVSELAEKITAIEYVEAAIEDAKENLKLNELNTEFSFYAGDMKALLQPELIQKEGKPDLVIVDPPRSGMVPKVVERIIRMAPEHIVYVSCKPATQARDIDLMREHYDILKVQPVDMFPQTAHVENVLLLKRKKGV